MGDNYGEKIQQHSCTAHNEFTSRKKKKWGKITSRAAAGRPTADVAVTQRSQGEQRTQQYVDETRLETWFRNFDPQNTKESACSEQQGWPGRERKSSVQLVPSATQHIRPTFAVKHHPLINQSRKNGFGWCELHGPSSRITYASAAPGKDRAAPGTLERRIPWISTTLWRLVLSKRTECIELCKSRRSQLHQ